jgi:hypothetical protein
MIADVEKEGLEVGGWEQEERSKRQGNEIKTRK